MFLNTTINLAQEIVENTSSITTLTSHYNAPTNVAPEVFETHYFRSNNIRGHNPTINLNASTNATPQRSNFETP